MPPAARPRQTGALFRPAAGGHSVIVLLLLALAALLSGLSLCLIAVNGRLTAEVQISLTGRRPRSSEVESGDA
ncbi:MAG: hypothetical protein QOE61_4815 [Micromonosporaceae bacterium]|nr:hypothetical protein [Micromonosporaceae bacterium]